MARVHHPDRVADEEKEAAKEKFNIIHQAYLVLVDPINRKAYDDGGQLISLTNSSAPMKWDSFIKTINDADIETKRRQYQGSSMEENDIIREIQIGNGSVTHLFNTIPYMRCEDEPRMIDVIKRCMNAGKIPKMAIRKMRI